MRRNIRKKAAGATLYLVVMVFMLYVGSVASAAQADWPHDIDVPEAKIVVYQPQLESFNDNKLTARAAVSVTKKGETEPVFGVVWFAARISTDRDTRIVRLLDLEVPQVKFPNADPAKVQKLKDVLNREILKWNPTISLDRILTMLDLVEKEKKASEDLKMSVPKIIVVKKPAVLVTIDGEPQLGKVEDSDLMRVMNTPFFIVLDMKTKKYYLKGGTAYLASSDIKGPWRPEPRPPTSVVVEVARMPQSNPQNAQTTDKPMPQIIVSTEPAELILIDGEPKYTPISATELLFVANTQSDLFMDIGTQLNFVLLSGRWFAAKKLDGTWSYVPADKLPGGFAKIPPDSAKGHVLASVAETIQATEATLDTYIPQTAAIKRNEAKVEVVYDGDPKFTKIDGTDMYYAVNTPDSVIRYGNFYYCCDNAVWFVASSPLGPWSVCVAVPQVIYTIPPSCPLYNVKYVHVYSYTPDIVYVGYTPGYVGCYPYRGVVVYGTGYVYHGWYHVHYYPRPVTWGVAVAYSPYTGGWAMRPRPFLGGLLRSAIRYEFWDHRLDNRPGRRQTNINVNVNKNIYAGGGRRPADRRAPRHPSGPGGTRRPPDRKRPGDSTGQRDIQRTGDRKNNVFAGRDGSVHRKTDQGWQQKNSAGWSDKKPATSSLDRQSAARNRGTTRTNTFKSSRSSGRTRSGGGGRRR